ncbi:MAG: peptidoglycan-binding protein [Alphaproteobacteria bacterium]|nr:peptidoglycan-binding protein [Alphaproteobacteria bacterium]
MFELFRTVGNNRENRAEDVFAVKDALSDFGFFDFGSNKAEPHGIFTRELDEGIKDFQSQNGLRVDGILKPKGETESAISRMFEKIGQRPNRRVFVPEKSSEFDVTGRMRRSEEMGKRREPLFNRDVLLSLADKYKPKPFGEEAIKKKLRERQVRLAATSVPVPKEKPDFSKQVAVQEKVPVPKEKPSILTGVHDEVVKSEIKNSEGLIEHLYKDTGKDGGFVTIGYGHKIDNVEKAKELPFEIKVDAGGYRKATPEEIEQAFRKIEVLKNANNTAKAYTPGEGELARQYDLDDLKLPEQEALRLLDKDLRGHARIVRQKFKNRGMDFDSFPPTVQKVFLDLQFNTGLDLDGMWKNLRDASKERNWDKAKQEINRPQVGKERQKWALEQLESGQEWEKQDR